MVVFIMSRAGDQSKESSPIAQAWASRTGVDLDSGWELTLLGHIIPSRFFTFPRKIIAIVYRPVRIRRFWDRANPREPPSGKLGKNSCGWRAVLLLGSTAVAMSRLLGEKCHEETSGG
jgi:hypothetical protein